ncbi:MSP domain-containing protein [Phanerochaete sordida]|uniref:MSP domain-containing protein n=1 Tax=Phanerochaete sordida TaxID=48140 RepID=A0A9P3LB63_9APHY|nr:MSP domain-containing protein [Phanerochaete sordida]
MAVCSPTDALVFHAPFTRESEAVLTLKNTAAEPVAFKVLANDVKALCVRPNKGRVAPGAKFEILVRLCAVKEEPAPGSWCKCRLKVCTIELSPERELLYDNDTLWSSIPKTDIHEQKLRCDYSWPPAGSLEAQLQEANAEIQRLRAQIAASPSSSSSAGNGADAPQRKSAIEKFRDNASVLSDGPPAYYECTDQSPEYVGQDEKGSRRTHIASSKPGLFARLWRMLTRRPRS